MSVLLGVVFVAAVAGLVVRRCLLIVEVEGASMKPTLHDGDRLLVIRLGGLARRGQVVVLDRERPGRPGRRSGEPRTGEPPPAPLIVKRVAGVAGDRISAELAGRANLPVGDRVPAGHVVILGDNAAASLDSRSMGYVPAERVAGVVVGRFPKDGRS
ncbi:S26 family signal peptidase [Sphaerimonospora cavernae]|uniref:S26 family signal peptidase n=1 Tax=Sphaerimonospora cavernae TaxID=1740611 RepID=A0ABV6UBI7_9ACTN